MLKWTNLNLSTNYSFIIKGKNRKLYLNLGIILHTYTVDDDAWLNIPQLNKLLSRLEQEASEYRGEVIGGYVNQYYLDVARPDDQTNKVSM